MGNLIARLLRRRLPVPNFKRVVSVKERCMSLQSHLSQLVRRHDALDREIASELIHPAANELKVNEMKRRKLLLKDEIEKLRGLGQALAPA
jgi:hypothetical protein